MHQLIIEKQAEIAAICQRYKVERLEVFGSAAITTDFDPVTSDIDFLVTYTPTIVPISFHDYWSMKEDLNSLLGRKVDLMEDGVTTNPLMRIGR